MESRFFLFGDSMRLCRHSRATGIAVYCLCFNLCFLSFPRLASANPALLALVAFEAPAIAEIFGVLGSYLFVGATTTAVTATTVGIAVELSRSTPVTGSALRTENKETALGMLLREGLITTQDLAIEHYKEGQLIMATSEVTGDVATALSLYGTPSIYNPVPIYQYIEQVPSVKYPLPEYSEVGFGLSSTIIAPYQLSASSYIDSSDNPQSMRYIYGGTAVDVFNGLLTYDSFMSREYKERLSAYNHAFVNDYYVTSACTTAHQTPRDAYSPVSLDPFVKTPLQMTISHSASTLPVMTGKDIIPQPVESRALYFMPEVTFNCVYLHEKLGDNGAVTFSELLHHSLVLPAKNTKVYLFPHQDFVDRNKPEDVQTMRHSLVLASLATDAAVLDKYRELEIAPARIAALYNALWIRASSRADYRGIPYTASNAVTAQMVQDIRDVRNIDLSIAGALVTPINQAGTREWDIPIYNVTNNTYVSMVTVQQNAEIDWGDYPSIPRPIVDAWLDLSPILNAFQWLFALNIQARKADCPVFAVDIAYLDFHDTLRTHCEVLNENEPTLKLFFSIVWVALGLRVTFRRR